MTAAAFALFVSSVEEHLVTRYGTRTFIGAERDKNGIKWNTKAIVAIPHDEYRRYRREYDRALRDKSLTPRTEAEWNAQNRSEEKSHKKPGAGTPSAPSQAPE